jgi:hypothetical protein
MPPRSLAYSATPYCGDLSLPVIHFTASVSSGSGRSHSKHWKERSPLPPGGSARIRLAPHLGQVVRCAWPMQQFCRRQMHPSISISALITTVCPNESARTNLKSRFSCVWSMRHAPVSIVPNGNEQNVYLVIDCNARADCFWREPMSDRPT